MHPPKKQLNQNLTNELLIGRHNEISDWKDSIEDSIRDTKNELHRLNYKKDLCARDLQNLNPKFTLINECTTLRSGRVKTNLCLDPVDVELDKVVISFIQLYCRKKYSFEN